MNIGGGVHLQSDEHWGSIFNQMNIGGCIFNQMNIGGASSIRRTLREGCIFNQMNMGAATSIR